MLMRIKKLKKSKKGFTLIELIVVIAILGILAAIAVPRLTGFQANAKIKADYATARTIAGCVSTAEADGTIVCAVAGRPTVAELVTAKYLATAPKSAQAPLTPFTITYAADFDITSIQVVGAGTATVYPAP